jgi:hypothetical protein
VSHSLWLHNDWVTAPNGEFLSLAVFSGPKRPLLISLLTDSDSRNRQGDLLWLYLAYNIFRKYSSVVPEHNGRD